MALETISQILSPTNATYINGLSAERRFSAAVLKNAYQGLVEKDGKGVNDKFVSSNDAEESAQVFVNRILPVKMQPREMGASKNGASFSANQHYTQTITVGIDILQVLDDPIIIPRARQDMIKVDLLAEQTEIFSNRFKTILNGATAASKYLAVYLAKAGGKSVNEKVISSSDVSNKLVLTRFIEANSLLDEGDVENGIDIFPEDTRVAVFKPSYRATLKTSGILVLGGANYAYDVAKGGAVSAGDTPRKVEDGFIGEIDGIPCHIISNESLRHMAGYLGFPEHEIVAGSFLGYISSSYANARGVSTSKVTKVIDSQAGQGLVLQPYLKFGCASWYHKGTVALTSASYDVIGGLKTLFTSVWGDIVIKLKGAGSRLFPEFTWTNVPDASEGKMKLSWKAEDDFGTDHEKGAFYVMGDEEITTVEGFLAAYSTASVKGAANNGTDTSAVYVADKYVTVLAIADDGSCALTCKKVVA